MKLALPLVTLRVQQTLYLMISLLELSCLLIDDHDQLLGLPSHLLLSNDQILPL